MTLQESKQKIRRKNVFDKYWYYALCALTISLSLLLLFFIIKKPDKFSGNHILHYSSFTLLFLMGVYGFYKLPNRYKIVNFENDSTLDRKKKALYSLVEYLESSPKLFNDNYISFIYNKAWWRSSYDIHLFFDERQICFSVQCRNSGDGGFIDFGGTEKLRTFIKEEIEFRLS